MLLNRFAAMCLVAAAFTLSACGGGGSSDDVAQAGPSAVNVLAAWRNSNTAYRVWTLSGRGDDNHDYSIRLESWPYGTGVFPLTNEAGNVMAQRGTVLRRDTQEQQTVTVFNHVDALGNLIGVRYTDGTCDLLAKPMPSLPTSAELGSAGALYGSTEYSSCNPASGVATGTSTYRWSVQRDQGVLLFCVDAHHFTASGAALGSDEQCFESSADGTLGERARITMNWPGQLRLVAKNY